jgi:hypothetical protein
VTPSELEQLKLNARIVALESMVVTIVGIMAQTVNTRDGLVEHLKQHPNSLSNMTIKGVSAEYSDLMAGEAQEAVSSLTAWMVRHLERKTFD